MTGRPALTWCDIESSGLEETRDYLLEVGFRITDADLRTISEASWVVPWNADGVRAHIRRSASQLVNDMHEASGLWYECSIPEEHGGISVASMARFNVGSWSARLVDWLIAAGAKGLPLAGSTVGFDRRWLDEWVPGFSGIPHYRSVDVSSIKVLFDLWAPEPLKAKQAELKPLKRHRVMPDLDDSIAELRFYREVLGLGVAS